MSATIHRLPFSPRPVIHVAPEDERDPHTAAIEMFKKFQQYARQNCGNIWTENVIRAALDFDNSNGWKERTRELLDGGKSNV